MFTNWSSGAPVGVGGFDFIGHRCFGSVGDVANESMMLQMAASLHLKAADVDKALKAARGVAATAQGLQAKAAGLETLLLLSLLLSFL